MKASKRIVPYLLPPLGVLLLLLPIAAGEGLFPFGEKSIAWCDMRQQVIPLWMQLQDVLRGEVSALWSPMAAGGMNLWGVIFFFVASPLSLLVLLVEKADFYLFANLFTLLKMMLASAAMQYFLRRRHPSLSVGNGTLLSIAYAFCGYTMFFYQNSIWLDVMLVFPLLFDGFLRLSAPRTGIRYLCWLSLTIAMNYYISYAVLLFLVLAGGAVCCFDCPPNQRGRYALRLGFFTGLSLLLTAPVWWVSLLEVLASARTVGLFASLAGGRWITQLPTTISFLGCSAVSVGLLLGASRRAWRTRPEGFLFLWMLLPIFLEPINKIWHTGSYQAFPVRYGFLLIFSLLSLVAGELSEPLTTKHNKGIAVAVASVLVLTGTAVLLWSRVGTGLASYVQSLWVSQESYRWLAVFFLLAILSAGLLRQLARAGWLSEKLFTLCLAGLVAVESLFSAQIYIAAAAKPDQDERRILALADQIADDDFYRVKMQRKYSDVNLLGGIGYPNLGHYTSLTREDTLFSAKRFGYSAYWMEIGSHGGTLLSDALLQNKYVIRRETHDPLAAQRLLHNGSYGIFRQNYELPFGIVSGASLEELLLPIPERGRVAYTESVLGRLLQSDYPVTVQYPPQGATNLTYFRNGGGMTLLRQDEEQPSYLTYTIAVEEPTALYFDCFDAYSTRLRESVYGAAHVWVNGNPIIAGYPNQRENGVLFLGVYEQEMVRITLSIQKDVSAHSLGISGISLPKAGVLLAGARGAALSVEQNQIVGTAVAEAANETLFLPIPYAEGWQAAVNGEQVPVTSVFAGWIALPLAAGENTIALRFIPVGWWSGWGMSGIAAALLLGYLLLRKREERPRWVCNLAGWGLLAAFVAVLLWTGIFPLLVHALG